MILVSIVLVACGGGATESPAAQETEAPVETEAPEEEAPAPEQPSAGSEVMLPEVDPLAVTGDIVTAGSSTVFPLSERMAERFQDEGYPGNITIDSIGSGAGFERFCVAGETDISNASRGIKDSEVESCQSIGREPIEFRVGTDAVAVTVSQENDFVSDVTMEELALIFGPAETWADVRSEWPAEAILRYIPGTDSGTFDFFVEEVFDEDEEPILSASNTQLSEDDNILVQGVIGSPYAVGFFGYAYYNENQDVLRVLSLEGVEPTLETVDSAEYALARPLFIYSDPTIMQSKAQVSDFINFYLTFVNEEIFDVGYFPASDAAISESKNAWLAAMGMGTMAEACTLPEVDPLSVSGDIVTAGSSTVFPLSERMAERFQDEGYADNITIDSIGSGAGFERFCVQGETDISNASRPIKDSEVESCRSIGREPIEIRVGTDALAVVVSKDNDFINNATFEELAAIFSTAETWADVNAAWPAEPIQRFIPGTDSGTFDFFVEEVFDKDEEPILNASNTQLSEDDNVLVQGVLGSPYAIGFFGYAYYAENTDVLKILSIEGVEPTGETVDSGDYPLARPLFIYSTADIMAEKPQVAAFINFYLTYVNEEVVDVGYFPASADALNSSMQAWLDAMAE
jgi:phosphate binding protein